MAKQIKMLFGVNNPAGPDLSTEARESSFIFWDPSISGTAEVENLEFCMHTGERKREFIFHIQ